MDEKTELIWVIGGAMGTFLLGLVSFVIRQALSGNATKENIQAETDLLKKDILHLNKEVESCEEKIAFLHKRISDLRESSKEMYVSKELFHQTIQQLNDKLDTILKFVEKG